MSDATIPRPVIATVSEILSQHYSHTQLERLFWSVNAPGETPGSNKLDKCMQWLERINEDGDLNPLEVLGSLLKEYMEKEFSKNLWGEPPEWEQRWIEQRKLINSVLTKHGLEYYSGGHVRRGGTAVPTRSLEQILHDRDLPAMEDEFNRAMANIENDPPASLTAACAIIEALCKVYIASRDLDLPKKQTIGPLWGVVRDDLGFDPSSMEDDDLKKILGGLSAIVDGVGALRTHASSAHGRGVLRYQVQPRHARLAVSEAHTVASFVMETWEERKIMLPLPPQRVAIG